MSTVLVKQSCLFYRKPWQAIVDLTCNTYHKELGGVEGICTRIIEYLSKNPLPTFSSKTSGKRRGVFLGDYSICLVLKCLQLGSKLPYLLNQTSLSISCRSRNDAAPPDMLNEIVAALEY